MCNLNRKALRGIIGIIVIVIIDMDWMIVKDELIVSNEKR